MIRKCKDCKKDVEVTSKCATIVICDECRVKKGFVPNEKRNYDTDDFIYCRICNKVKRRLDLHIIKFHKKTIEEYQTLFPNAPIYAKNTTIKKRSRDQASRQKTSIKIKESWQRPDVRQRRTEMYTLHNPMRGKHHSIETKLKLSKAANYKHSFKGKRKDIQYSVRSMIEANMCRLLDYKNIKYEYENRYFDLQDGTILIIDFFLHDDFEMIKGGSYLELKGWIDKNTGHFLNKEKFDIFKKLYPNEYERTVFIFQKSDEWNYLEKKYKPLIPLWETAKHNLHTHPEIYSETKINEKELWDEFIICPLCLRDGESELQARHKFLSACHLLSHGYTFKKFRDEFPNCKLKIDSIGKQHSEKLKGSNHFNYGKHLSEETCLKISSGVQKTNELKKCTSNPRF